MVSLLLLACQRVPTIKSCLKRNTYKCNTHKISSHYITEVLPWHQLCVLMSEKEQILSVLVPASLLRASSQRAQMLVAELHRRKNCPGRSVPAQLWLGSPPKRKVLRQDLHVNRLLGSDLRKAQQGSEEERKHQYRLYRAKYSCSRRWEHRTREARRTGGVGTLRWFHSMRTARLLHLPTSFPSAIGWLLGTLTHSNSKLEVKGCRWRFVLGECLAEVIYTQVNPQVVV